MDKEVNIQISVKTPHTLRAFAFLVAMGYELERNAHKGDWNEWKPTPEQLSKEIEHHCQKLFKALMENDVVLITEYAADLGNYAQKAFSLYGMSLAEKATLDVMADLINENATASHIQGILNIPGAFPVARVEEGVKSGEIFLPLPPAPIGYDVPQVGQAHPSMSCLTCGGRVGNHRVNCPIAAENLLKPTYCPNCGGECGLHYPNCPTLDNEIAEAAKANREDNAND